MALLNVVNTGDIQVLQETVRSYQSALAHERDHAERLEQQRNHESMDANVFAAMARSLAKELNMSKKEVQELRAKCRQICEEDLRKRGIRDVLEHPPNFTLSLR